MTQTEFETVIDRALELLPPEISAAMDNIAIMVEDRPGPADFADVGLTRHDYLFGLFRGIPLTERSFFERGGHLPHQIILFKQELEDFCRSEAELVEQIILTLIHEVGHYIGLNEEELRELEFQATRARMIQV